MTGGYDKLKAKLAASTFRSRFRLTESGRAYLALKGWAAIRAQTRKIILARLAPASPLHDGRQTPMGGHVVFTAQHATATCCRTCLARWHGIKSGHELTAAETAYVVAMILAWLQDQAGDLSALPHTPDLF